MKHSVFQIFVFLCLIILPCVLYAATTAADGTTDGPEGTDAAVDEENGTASEATQSTTVSEKLEETVGNETPVSTVMKDHGVAPLEGHQGSVVWDIRALAFNLFLPTLPASLLTAIFIYCTTSRKVHWSKPIIFFIIFLALPVLFHPAFLFVNWVVSSCIPHARPFANGSYDASRYFGCVNLFYVFLCLSFLEYIVTGEGTRDPIWIDLIGFLVGGYMPWIVRFSWNSLIATAVSVVYVLSFFGNRVKTGKGVKTVESFEAKLPMEFSSYKIMLDTGRRERKHIIMLTCQLLLRLSYPLQLWFDCTGERSMLRWGYLRVKPSCDPTVNYGLYFWRPVQRQLGSTEVETIEGETPQSDSESTSTELASEDPAVPSNTSSSASTVPTTTIQTDTTTAPSVPETASAGTVPIGVANREGTVPEVPSSAVSSLTISLVVTSLAFLLV